MRYVVKREDFCAVRVQAQTRNAGRRKTQADELLHLREALAEYRMQHCVQRACVRDDQDALQIRRAHFIQRLANAPANGFERVTAGRLVAFCRRQAVLRSRGPTRRDLFPCQAFPFTECKLAPARIAFDRQAGADNLRRFIRAAEVAGNRAIESFIAQSAR